MSLQTTVRKLVKPKNLMQVFWLLIVCFVLYLVIAALVKTWPFKTMATEGFADGQFATLQTTAPVTLPVADSMNNPDIVSQAQLAIQENAQGGVLPDVDETHLEFADFSSAAAPAAS
eukprot:jgi/Astpho2/5801/fgenesh1_pg.00080_%23_54_t